MSETPVMRRLAEKIFARVQASIDQSHHSFFWKRRAIYQAKNIFQNQNINIDLLVEYLINEEIKVSPQKLHMASVEHRALLKKALYGTILNRVNGGQISEDFVMKIIDGVPLD